MSSEPNRTDDETCGSMMLTIECEEIIELDDHLLTVECAESQVYEAIKSENECDEEFDSMKSESEKILQYNLPTISNDCVNDNSMKHKYTCGPCDKTFVYSLNLDQHIQKSHVDFTPILCMHCGGTLSSVNDVKVHEAKCREEHVHVSTVCYDSFANVPEVTSHFEKTPGNELQFICTQCDNIYRTLEKLNVHKMKCKVRDETLQHNECMLCDIQFIGPDDLKRHLDTEHGHERPFQCSHCGKTFIQSSHLKQHVKQIHFGERPFVCNQCDKKFAQSSHLKLHIRHLHSDERPFACLQCNKRFPMASTLQRHELVHSGEKPYMCVLCRKMFRQLSTLRRHELSHERYHRMPL